MALFGGENTGIKIVIRARNEASKAFQSAQKDAQNFTSRMEKMQPAFRKMAVAGAAATTAITVGIGKAVKEASRVQEIDRLFEATFDKSEESMADWSKSVADEFGRAEQDIRQMAAVAGSVISPAFDIAEEEVARLTQGMGRAAIALEGTNPMIDSAQQAMEGFTQGVTGNRQRLIDWGFQVRDAQLGAKAIRDGMLELSQGTLDLENGLVHLEGETMSLEKAYGELTRELTRQEQAMVTAEAITEQVSISTEVLKDSQEDWSQIQKRLAGQTKELMAVLGKEFLPIVEKIGSELVPVIKNIREWVEANPKFAASIVTASLAIAGLVTALGTIGIIVVPVVKGFIAVKSAISAVMVVIPLLGKALMLLVANPIGAVIAAVALAAILIIKNWDKIKVAWFAAVEIISDKLSDFASFWRSVWDTIIKNVSEAWETLKNIVKTGIQLFIGIIALGLDALIPNWEEKLRFMIDVWISTWDKIKQILTTTWEVLTNFIQNTLAFIVSFISSQIENIKGVINTGLKFIKAIWSDIWDSIKEATIVVTKAIKDPVEKVLNFIADKIEKVVDAYQKMKNLVSKPIKGAGNAVSGFFSRALERGRELTSFQHGGVVQAPKGVPTPIMAHGQERIIPAGHDDRGRGGNTFNVQIIRPEIRNDRDVDLLKREIDRALRGLVRDHKLETI